MQRFFFRLFFFFSVGLFLGFPSMAMAGIYGMTPLLVQMSIGGMFFVQRPSSVILAMIGSFTSSLLTHVFIKVRTMFHDYYLYKHSWTIVYRFFSNMFDSTLNFSTGCDNGDRIVSSIS